MKPRNFPSRKLWRRKRAEALRRGEFPPPAPPHVVDTTFRIGKAARRTQGYDR